MLRQNRDEVVSTHEVMRATRDLLLAAEDAETGQRGFVITGNEVFLDPYRKAVQTTLPGALLICDPCLLTTQGKTHAFDSFRIYSTANSPRWTAR